METESESKLVAAEKDSNRLKLDNKILLDKLNRQMREANSNVRPISKDKMT